MRTEYNLTIGHNEASELLAGTTVISRLKSCL